MSNPKKGTKTSPYVELEDFHDDDWTPPKLIVLGGVTLSIALFVIWLISELGAGSVNPLTR